jgi:hypothetical protein
MTKVVITQLTQIQDAPLRNKTLIFDFVNKFTCSDSWRDFTNQGEVVVPKNLYVKDQNDKLIQLSDISQNIGGFSFDNSQMPLLMRGDRVTMDYAYKYFDPKQGKEVEVGTASKGTSGKIYHLFNGFISEVTSKKPITFKCEDLMWKLKQTPAPIRTFKETDSLEYILTEILKPYNSDPKNTDKIKVTTTTKTTFGAFRTGNETVAEVLSRLRKQYHFESYLNDGVLICGISIYSQIKPKTHVFTFQESIISDELTYKRKEDIVVSILASSTNEEETGETTKDGQAKTKCKRLEVLLTLRDGSDIPIIFHKNKDEKYPENLGGERYTIPWPGTKTMEELIAKATDEIKKYYYSGFRGKFTTFGIPVVKMGDNIQIYDPKLPERNGLYKCKGVDYEAGIGGIRQAVQLDYLIV